MNKENSIKSLEKKLLKEWPKAKAAKRGQILDIFYQQVSFLQHERMIHLLVTLFFGAICVFFGVISLGSNNLYFLIIFLIVLITELFYVFHYYYLENTCQYWEDLYIKLKKENLATKRRS